MINTKKYIDMINHKLKILKLKIDNIQKNHV